MNDLFDYKQELDALQFTPEQKAHIAAQAAKAVRQENRRSRHPVRKITVIAAAAVLVLAVGTAGATGILRSAVESFSGIFGDNVAQTEIIDKIGRPIGASDTSGGVTITADAIIGDAYNACIVYTLTRDDGTVFDYTGNEYGYLPLHFKDHDTDLGFRGGSHGSSYFVDQTPGDNAIQFVEAISSDTKLQLSSAKASFENLCLFDEETGEDIPLAEGTWMLRFDASYEDASITLGGGETFRQDGMTFTVTGITVSPVAVRVDYEVDSEVRWSDAPSGRVSDEDRLTQQRYFENVTILLTKSDGTVIDLSLAGGSIRPQDGKTVCSKGQIMDEIIPLEELEQISIGGIVYPIH